MSDKPYQKVWFACEEHLDNILDDIVDYQAIAPSLSLWDNPVDSTQFPGAHCEKCGRSPDYILTYTKDQINDADSSDHRR